MFDSTARNQVLPSPDLVASTRYYPHRTSLPQPWVLLRILPKPTSRNDAPRRCNMTARPPKATQKSLQIEPGGFRIPFLMIFAQTSILNDSTMNFMVFQVRGVPRTTQKPPKLTPGIILKLCIEKSPSKAPFVSKSDVPGPPKWPSKSLKNRPWTSKGLPGDPKVPQSSPKHLQGLKNNAKSCSKHSQYAKTNHQSPATSHRLPVTSHH